MIEYAQSLVDGTEPAEARVRLEAAKWLMERMVGKAPIDIKISGQVNHLHANINLGELSLAELNAIESIVTGERDTPVSGDGTRCLTDGNSSGESS